MEFRGISRVEKERKGFGGENEAGEEERQG